MDGEIVAEVARKSAIRSAISYYKISDGCSIHEGAIETLVSSDIAKDVHRKTGLSIQLEVPFQRVFELSGAERRGGLGRGLGLKKRYDIVIFQNQKPIGIIEVKKRFAPYQADNDLMRVSSSVDRFGENHNGSVRFGVWIAIQRIRDNQRLNADERVENFNNAFDFGDLYSETRYNQKDGNFGITKRGNNVTGMIAYSVLFNHNNNT